MGENKPWWATDPEIEAIRRGVMEEIETAGREPIRPDVPNPVLADLLSGGSVRELGDARDALACAKARYAKAVHTARAAGLSWGEIGRVLGVSKQQLHRRFSRPAPTTTP